MTNVYRFPPVSVYGTEWTADFKTSRSTSLITGRRYVSSFQRVRRKSVIEVAGLGVDDMGAGYVEALKELIKGGEHLVRVDRISPMRQKPITLGQTIEVVWSQGGTEVVWQEGGVDIQFLRGTTIFGTAYTLNGMPAIYIEDMPAKLLLGRPSDRLRWIPDVGDEVILTNLSVVKTNNAGQANVISSEPLVAGSGRIEFGYSESLVFETDFIPRITTPVNGDWVYSFALSQVFEDEAGPFVELDPWAAER